MIDKSELVEEYCQSLNDLKSNSKPMIKALTMLASDYTKVDKEIVERIKNLIFEVDSERKLPFLYLMDSICKCVGLNYVELFSSHLVSLFVHVYSAGDLNTKNALIKLRRTWNPPNNLFQPNLLNDLDKNIKFMDSNWPFAQRISEIANISNLKSPEKSSPLKSPTQQSLLLEIDQHYHSKSLKQNNQNSNVNYLSRDSILNDIAYQKNNIATSTSSFNYVNNNQQVTQFNGNQQFNCQFPLSNNVNNQLNDDYNNSIDYHLDKIYNTAQPFINSNSSFINNNSFLNYNPIQNGVNNKVSVINKNTYGQKYNQMQKNHHNRNKDFKNNKNDGSSSYNRKRSFEDRSNSYNHKRSPLTNLSTRSNYEQKCFNRPNSYNNNSKNQFSTSPINNQLSKPLESKILFEGRYYKIYHLDENTSIILLNCPTNLTFDQIQGQYQNVYQLDPRLVYFEGSPVNVYIDEIDSIYLPFNNLWKSFFINGYEQLIKFGGPGREIHLNNQILSASFGGPPVSCVLNGDSAIHTLRLDCPAPRIKLSDKPRVDVWYSFVKKYRSIVKPNQNLNGNVSNNNNNRTAVIRHQNQYIKQHHNQFHRHQGSYHQSNHSCVKTNSTELNDLVNSIKSFNNSSDLEPAFNQSALHNNPKNEDFDDLELTKESLMKRRPHLIDSLYNGIQCTSCSLRFNIDSSEKKRLYSKHLDWHFRKNRKSRSNVVSSLNRDWYYPFSLWSQFKEINLDDEIVEEKKEEKTNIKPINNREVKLVPIKSNSNDALNFCSTCLERFDQIWSDDEDEWLLSKAVLVNDKYYHSICIPSAASEEGLNQSSRPVHNIVEDNHETVIDLNDKKVDDLTAAFDNADEIDQLNKLKVTTDDNLSKINTVLDLVKDSDLINSNSSNQLFSSNNKFNLDAVFDHNYCKNPPFHNNKDISSLCSIM